MSAFPPLNLFATDAYAYLEPIAEQDADNGYVLAALIGAFGIAFDQIEAVSRAGAVGTHPNPYQQVYDVTICPDDRVPGLLGWLGQFVGVPWVAYSDSTVKRTQVEMETQFYRGSIANIEAAVIATQTPPGACVVVERTPDAWGLAVAYDPSVTPNLAETEAAAIAAVPWALALTFTSSSLPIWEEGGPTRTFEGVASGVTFESATLTNIS